MDIVYQVQLNPIVQKPLYELIYVIQNVYIISILEYIKFV